MITQRQTLQTLHSLRVSKRVRLVNEAVKTAASDDAEVTAMAQSLADSVKKLGVVGALELLAAIGWRADEIIGVGPKNKGGLSPNERGNAPHTINYSGG